MTDTDADAIFRALADPTRREIFEQLTYGELRVADLTVMFDISQPAISQHLRALRGAGLVRDRREGREAFYSVDPAGLRPLANWIEYYQAFWVRKLQRLNQVLEEMDE